MAFRKLYSAMIELEKLDIPLIGFTIRNDLVNHLLTQSCSDLIGSQGYALLQSEFLNHYKNMILNT